MTKLKRRETVWPRLPWSAQTYVHTAATSVRWSTGVRLHAGDTVSLVTRFTYTPRSTHHTAMSSLLISLLLAPQLFRQQTTKNSKIRTKHGSTVLVIFTFQESGIVELLRFRWDSEGNPPDGSLAEVTVCVCVAELGLNATGRCLAITEWTGETHLTGFWFTATVWAWTVITLSMDTGTGCGDAGELLAWLYYNSQ